MNQYTAPMPGHFMWHLFSIPLLDTKSWPAAAAHCGQSLSARAEVCNLHRASSHLSSHTSLAQRAFVFSQEFGCISMRTGAEQREKSNY